MTVNLELDPQLLATATELAEASGRSVGSVVSELALRGLKQDDPSNPAAVRIEMRDGLPVAIVDPSPPRIDPDVVRRELEENG